MNCESNRCALSSRGLGPGGMLPQENFVFSDYLRSFLVVL